MILIRDPKTFYFYFDWPNDVDENSKKNNESLAENKIKSEIKQLLLKYKDRNDSHEHGKQQNV